VVRADGRAEAGVGLADDPLLDEQQVPLEADGLRGPAQTFEFGQVPLGVGKLTAAPGGAGRLEPAGGIVGAEGEVAVQPARGPWKVAAGQRLTGVLPGAPGPVAVPLPVPDGGGGADTQEQDRQEASAAPKK
jgi:hypothetical protein